MEGFLSVDALVTLDIGDVRGRTDGVEGVGSEFSGCLSVLLDYIDMNKAVLPGRSMQESEVCPDCRRKGLKRARMAIIQERTGRGNVAFLATRIITMTVG